MHQIMHQLSGFVPQIGDFDAVFHRERSHDAGRRTLRIAIACQHPRRIFVITAHSHTQISQVDGGSRTVTADDHAVDLRDGIQFPRRLDAKSRGIGLDTAAGQGDIPELKEYAADTKCEQPKEREAPKRPLIGNRCFPQDAHKIENQQQPNETDQQEQNRTKQ